MGRAPCCDENLGLKKGPWTPDEDQKLVSYIRRHGHGSWRALPEKAGLKRCGKSCRLRWTNYLRPDIKRGRFSFEEDRIIVQLHAILGNRWSAIASHLPRRTDNEIKNYWNTHLKKRLTPTNMTPHQKPSSCNTTTLPPAAPDVVTQWDLTIAEAEARLARRHTNPFLKPSFTTPPPMHPSALFMRSWKTDLLVDDAHHLRPVKLEPTPDPRPIPNHPGAVAGVAELGGALSSGLAGGEVFVVPSGLSGEARSGDFYPGSVIGRSQNEPTTESPTSVLHGPDVGASSSPCGRISASDCFGLIPHQCSTGFRNFPEQEPTGSGVLDLLWPCQQNAAMRPDGVQLGGHATEGGGELEFVDVLLPLWVFSA